MASKVPATKTILLIDIAHTSVGVGVLVNTTGSIPKLVANWRETVPQDPAEERQFNTTVRIMRKLIEKANAAGYAAWDAVHCGVGTPWVITHVRSLHHAPASSFVVTERLLASLDQQDSERFISRAVYQQSFADHRHILDHRRLAVVVNGHTFPNPIGQRARELNVHYFVSGMNPDYYAQLRSGIYAVTRREATITASSLAQWEGISLLQGADNYSVLDVHGGFGDCTVVRDRVPALTVATTVSEERYSADVANALQISLRETEQMRDLHARGVLDEASQLRLREAEELVQLRYVPQLHTLFTSITEHGFIPRTVFVVGQSSSAPIARLLELPEFSEYTTTRTPLTPIVVSGSLLADRIDTAALHRVDPALLIASLAHASRS